MNRIRIRLTTEDKKFARKYPLRLMRYVEEFPNFNRELLSVFRGAIARSHMVKTNHIHKDKYFEKLLELAWIEEKFN